MERTEDYKELRRGQRRRSYANMSQEQRDRKNHMARELYKKRYKNRTDEQKHKDYLAKKQYYEKTKLHIDRSGYHKDYWKSLSDDKKVILREKSRDYYKSLSSDKIKEINDKRNMRRSKRKYGDYAEAHRALCQLLTIIQEENTDGTKR